MYKIFFEHMYQSNQTQILHISPLANPSTQKHFASTITGRRRLRQNHRPTPTTATNSDRQASVAGLLALGRGFSLAGTFRVFQDFFSGSLGQSSAGCIPASTSPAKHTEAAKRLGRFELDSSANTVVSNGQSRAQYSAAPLPSRPRTCAKTAECLEWCHCVAV